MAKNGITKTGFYGIKRTLYSNRSGNSKGAFTVLHVPPGTDCRYNDNKVRVSKVHVVCSFDRVTGAAPYNTPYTEYCGYNTEIKTFYPSKYIVEPIVWDKSDKSCSGGIHLVTKLTADYGWIRWLDCGVRNLPKGFIAAVELCSLLNDRPMPGSDFIWRTPVDETEMVFDG